MAMPFCWQIGKQLVHGDLVEQRVATGAHEGVEVTFPREAGEHLGLVHAGTDGRHDTLLAQLGEGREGATDGLLPVVVRVVDPETIDAIDAQALEAVLDRAHDAVVAVVVDGPEVEDG